MGGRTAIIVTVVATVIAAALIGFFSPVVQPLRDLWLREVTESLADRPPVRARSEYVLLVANFEGDGLDNAQADRVQRRLLAELNRHTSSPIGASFLEILRLPQTVEVGGDAGAALLREHGADVLLAGRVNPQNEELEISVRFAHSAAITIAGTELFGSTYALTDLKIGADLADEIFPLVATIIAMELAQRAPALAPARLEFTLRRLEPLVSQTPTWLTGHARTIVFASYAEGLRILGSRTRDRARLIRSVEIFTQLTVERISDPVLNAAIQRGRATSLEAFDLVDDGHSYEEEVIAALEAGVSPELRAAMPELWADMQVRIGYALGQRGRWSWEPRRTRQAIERLELASLYWTRERDIVRWAMIRDDQASMYSRLGEITHSQESLERAIEGHTAAATAFAETYRQRQAAITHNNLGRSLYLLGKERNDGSLFRRAMTSYALASEYFRTEGRESLAAWATVQHNYADALIEIGRAERATSNLERAVAINRQVLQIRQARQSNLEVALTFSRLSEALELIADRTSDAALYREALDAARSAHAIYLENGRDNLVRECAERIRRIEGKLLR